LPRNEKAVIMAAVARGSEGHRQDLFLHIVKDPDSPPSPTTKKVIKVAAIILMALGIALILAGSAFFGMGVVGAISAIGLASAQAMIPLGVISLISGCHLWQNSERGTPPKLSSVNVGGLSFSY
jgi:hypothetical protein